MVATEVLDEATHEARATAMELLEALWSRGDDAPLRAIVHPDFTYRRSSSGDPLDLGAYLAMVAVFRKAFDPIDLLFHRVLVEGDRVLAHYSFVGTHVGPIFGIEATDRQHWVPVMTFMYFENASLVRQTSLTDFLSLQRQLRSPV